MKNILLAVAGLSPQVITETLFALHQQGRRVDAVYVITTRRGKEAINALLLAPTDGFYVRYLAEYAIDPAEIDFSPRNIRTVKDGVGRAIEDITNEEENERLLQACLDLAYELTGDPESSVFFSIAGGRKTMSVCLMVAAQFYGRPQDRIYHVLVSPDFENHPDFFYPPIESVPLELIDGKGERCIKETRYAAVTLAPIPFISMRDRISDRRDRPKKPADLMRTLIKDHAHTLTIDLKAGTITYREKRRPFAPARLALYAFFTMNKAQCRDPRPTCTDCRNCYLDFPAVSDRQADINRLYAQASRGRTPDTAARNSIRNLDAENFNALKSKIRKDLQEAFGLYALAELAIEGAGRKPDRRYGLRIDRKKIRVVI